MPDECDPSELANAARCFSQCIPPGMQTAVQNYLLCQIAVNGGGGGGTKQVFSGAGVPVADPGVTPALYIDENDGTLYYWYAAAWH